MLLLIDRFVKRWGQAVIQIIKKGEALCGISNVTKSSFLGVVRVLNSTLELYNVF